jgi:hypothetical protein
MCEQIIVCIFCVFNISKTVSANNPPPIPYLDINKLKQLFYFQNVVDSERDEFVKEGQKIINMIIEKQNIKPSKSDENESSSQSKKERLEELKNISEEKLESDPKLKTELNALMAAPTKEFDPELHNFNDKVSGLKNIKTKINNIEINIFNTFNDLIKDLDEAKADIIKRLKTTYSGVERLYVKAFIDMIDKSNAASAIGTLEFLDQLAKYNKVETICTENENFLTEGHPKVPKMKELYSNN